MTYKEAQQMLEELFVTAFSKRSNSIERSWGNGIGLQTRMVIDGDRLKLRTLITVQPQISLSASEARHHLAQLTMATATAEHAEEVVGSLSWDAESELLGASV